MFGGNGGGSQSTSVVYFTTSIINGSTIASRELDFTITHKQQGLSLRSTSVEVNGSAVPQFSGRVQLEDAAETADSMRCRGYGLPGRTAYACYGFEMRDGALLAKPDILLMDEPTKGMDSENKRAFAQIIHGLCALGVAG